MITMSDNTASLWCQQLAGTGVEINKFLEKNGFKSFYTNTIEGWTPAAVKIGEECNKIEIETPVMGTMLGLTLTRK